MNEVGSVEVASSITGNVVTSVDTGAPIDAYVADGTDTDSDFVPFPVGTVIVKDRSGYVSPVTNNASYLPTITVNATQTWAVAQEVLRRESLIFSKPTKYGRFYQPLNWSPSSQISEQWGKLQIIIGGVDVTYFRSHPTELGAWSSNEPNGDAACSITFPQISWFERPNHGALTWIQDARDVTIVLIRPNGVRKELFAGILVSTELSGDGQGVGVTLNVLGTLYQADHSPYIQELYKKNRDIGTAIADIMDGTVSRHFLPCNRPVTGIKTNIRGSGGARLTQGVQDLLSTAFTSNAQNQWTITNLPGRKPYIKLKDKTTRHWIMAIGHPGLKLQLTNDWQQISCIVYGSGIANDGGTWFNAKYPGIKITNAPLYPLGVGQVFSAGNGRTGFDVFADELRTRGYSIQSRDTYVSSDISDVKDAQRRAGITADGVVGAQTWSTMFGVGGSVPSLAGSHIAPLATVSAVMANLERPDGSIIGRNPKYERDRLAIGRLIEYGEGVSKAEGVTFARGEIQARLNFDPQWVGSATLTMDPENGSRWEMRAGENIFIKFMYPPLRWLWRDDGLLLHISQVTVTPGGDVTLQLSYLGHDMTSLAAIKKRNKDTLDPARRGPQGRASKISKDNIIPWDSEAGGGKIPLHNLQGGFWTVIRIPAGQIGNIVKTNFVCATSLGVNSISSAFSSESALGGAKPFCIAVFNKPVTSNFLKGTVGNPLTNESVWSKKAVVLQRAGLIQAYGASDQAAGYWPGQGSSGDSVTGKLQDGTGWTWESASPPFLWIAEYCASSTRIAGQLRNAPLGS